ncbi:MAG: hypothetical protein SPC28_04100 [Alloprevotella sp.]|nr:hypothetical protein [Bacteroidales bacterium]MDY4663365.1 hypothetical protein [Alloprevotella sp.]
MIRTLFFTALLFCPLASPAQDVYKMVLDNATRIVNTPTSGYTQTQIAQFKRTALIYIKSKAFEQSETVSAQFLDTQAYYLSEFLTLFFSEVIDTKRLSDNKRRKRIALFMETSAANPLFNDPDTETTMSYINEGGEITPFSIDTDWQKAYLAAQERLKEER